MSTEQIEAYEGEAEVYSDPLGLIDRDNRNHRKKAAIVLENVNAEWGDAVLEVGCGHGLHARYYDEAFYYYGVDISQSLVAETQERIDQGVVTQGDAMNLPYADNAFDAVVGSAILHHLHDAGQALEEWQRVVKPGGSVTLMEPNPVFPKDFISLFTQEKEKHKWQLIPWRIRDTLERVTDEYRLEPQIYTPPVPNSLVPFYDGIDSAMKRVPGVRWTSQMLLIHIEV